MKQAEFDDKVIALQVQFEKNREELKDKIHYALYHWHTPKHGIRTKEEHMECRSYRELHESLKLIKEMVGPKADFRFNNGNVEVRNLWFYKKWSLINPDEWK